jgi:lipooligosaccharide transport system permease protein
VVLGEAVWAASKSLLSGLAVLLVAAVLGLCESPLSLWVIPVIFIAGLAFGSLGLIMTALSPSYDFFVYYMTLVITPMMLMSGVFFPADQLPAAVHLVTTLLPLSHAVDLVRPLMSGSVPAQWGWHLCVLAVYAIIGFYLALALTRRRLLK